MNVRKSNLHISLVLATVDRTEELRRFFEHLNVQTYREFDVIIVDQNPDDRLVPVVKAYQQSFPILHLRHIPRGLSRARNVGLEHVEGDIVGFPDDDCWYPPTLLEEVACFLREHSDVDVLVLSGGKTGLISKIMDRLYRGKPRRVSFLSLPNAERMFLRAHVVRTVGKFDEDLGLGAGTPWIACDDMDYGIRILKAGFKMYQSNRLPAIYDPPNPELSRVQSLERAHRYGLSAGYVWQKHNLPFWLGLVRIGAAIFAMLEQLARGNFGHAHQKFYWIRGFAKGWMKKW